MSVKILFVEVSHNQLPDVRKQVPETHGTTTGVIEVGLLGAATMNPHFNPCKMRAISPPPLPHGPIRPYFPRLRALQAHFRVSASSFK